MNLLKTLVIALTLYAGSAFASDPVNINTADAKALAEAMQNVGPAKAQSIVAYREAHGPFQSIEALVKVKGIGLTTVEDNRDVITVSEPDVTGTK